MESPRKGETVAKAVLPSAIIEFLLSADDGVVEFADAVAADGSEQGAFGVSTVSSFV